MKISDLLPKLAKNDSFKIIIATSDNNSMIEFNPSGYAALSEAINNREVDEIKVFDSIIKIWVTDVEPDPEPTPTPGGD